MVQHNTAFSELSDEVEASNQGITEKMLIGFCRREYGLALIQYGRDDFYVIPIEGNGQPTKLISQYIEVRQGAAEICIEMRIVVQDGTLDGMPKYYARPYLGDDKDFGDRVATKYPRLLEMRNTYFAQNRRTGWDIGRH